MNTFKEFVDKKSRDAKKQLEIIKKVLTKEGMTVTDFLDEEEPYIYLRSTTQDLPFDGVRIYRIGDSIAYRVQKEARTHPFGKAYPLDIEAMFEDLITDDEMNERTAGEEIIKAIAEDLKNFFKKSSNADKENRADDMDQQREPSHISVSSSSGTDYSSMVHSSNK